MSDDERYIGLVTRTVAFALDAAVINVVALLVSLGASLILSLFHVESQLKDVLLVIGTVIYVLWTIAYFVVFWSTTGETPGDRMMRCRVVAVGGERIKPRRALLRCIGLLLSAIPLFAGYLLILFDGRRRAFHDRLARTVVIESATLSLAEQRRIARRTARALRMESDSAALGGRA